MLVSYDAGIPELETPMSKTLHYIFDPLCGWCYGAGASLGAIAGTGAVDVRLWPSGLFSGDGARPMDDAFAAYAWSNDQRIERLTGQRFSERNRAEVLSDRRQMFDSGPASVALTAVMQSRPERELEALEAIQQARYVDGQDVTRPDTLAAILEGLGLRQAALRLTQPDAALLDDHRERMSEAQSMLRQFGARGVPTFIVEREGARQLLNASALFSDPQAFVDQLTGA
jgi:putative protein-disulfide isomerase